MASGPITSGQIDGETVSDLIFFSSKITEDGDCSHEIKRYLLLGRAVMTNLDSILKSRDITLPAKVHIVKGFFIDSGLNTLISEVILIMSSMLLGNSNLIFDVRNERL